MSGGSRKARQREREYKTLFDKTNGQFDFPKFSPEDRIFEVEVIKFNRYLDFAVLLNFHHFVRRITRGFHRFDFCG